MWETISWPLQETIFITGSNEASCPDREAHRARKEGGYQATLRTWSAQSNNPRGTKACQQPLSKLGSDSFPGWWLQMNPQSWLVAWWQCCERAWIREPSPACLTHGECKVMNMCSFGLLSFEAICSTVIDNQSRVTLERNSENRSLLTKNWTMKIAEEKSPLCGVGIILCYLPLRRREGSYGSQVQMEAVTTLGYGIFGEGNNRIINREEHSQILFPSSHMTCSLSSISHQLWSYRIRPSLQQLSFWSSQTLRMQCPWVGSTSSNHVTYFSKIFQM